MGVLVIHFWTGGVGIVMNGAHGTDGAVGSVFRPAGLLDGVRVHVAVRPHNGIFTYSVDTQDFDEIRIRHVPTVGKINWNPMFVPQVYINVLHWN